MCNGGVVYRKVILRTAIFRTAITRMLAPLCIALGTSLLGGCSLVSISDTSHYSDDEGKVPETVLEQIQPNVTSKAWVVAHFGQPVSVQHTPAGHDVYNYQFTRVHRKSASVLFLVRYRGIEQDREYFHVAFEGDLVQKHWVDQLPLVQLETGVTGVTGVTGERAALD